MYDVLNAVQEAKAETLHYDDCIEIISQLAKKFVSPFLSGLPKPKTSEFQLDLSRLSGNGKSAGAGGLGRDQGQGLHRLPFDSKSDLRGDLRVNLRGDSRGDLRGSNGYLHGRKGSNQSSPAMRDKSRDLSDSPKGKHRSDIARRLEELVFGDFEPLPDSDKPFLHPDHPALRHSLSTPNAQYDLPENQTSPGSRSRGERARTLSAGMAVKPSQFAPSRDSTGSKKNLATGNASQRNSLGAVRKSVDLNSPGKKPQSRASVKSNASSASKKSSNAGSPLKKPVSQKTSTIKKTISPVKTSGLKSTSPGSSGKKGRPQPKNKPTIAEQTQGITGRLEALNESYSSNSPRRSSRGNSPSRGNSIGEGHSPYRPHDYGTSAQKYISTVPGRTTTPVMTLTFNKVSAEDELRGRGNYKQESFGREYGDNEISYSSDSQRIESTSRNPEGYGSRSSDRQGGPRTGSQGTIYSPRSPGLTTGRRGSDGGENREVEEIALLQPQQIGYSEQYSGKSAFARNVQEANLQKTASFSPSELSGKVSPASEYQKGSKYTAPSSRNMSQASLNKASPQAQGHPSKYQIASIENLMARVNENDMLNTPKDSKFQLQRGKSDGTTPGSMSQLKRAEGSWSTINKIGAQPSFASTQLEDIEELGGIKKVDYAGTSYYSKGIPRVDMSPTHMESKIRKLERITKPSDGAALVSKIRESFAPTYVKSDLQCAQMSLSYIDESQYNDAIEANAFGEVVEEVQVN